MSRSNSQAGQDRFALWLIGTIGTFVDIGCQLPIEINNTLMLEGYGWRGVAIDVENWSAEWAATRLTPFICTDALQCDYSAILRDHGLNSPVDYLSLDVEGAGARFHALKRIVDAGIEFKAATIEHDAYRGYSESERVPQRMLLKSLGYVLACADVCSSDGTPFEDWWVNPRYIPPERYASLVSEGQKWTELVRRMA